MLESELLSVFSEFEDPKPAPEVAPVFRVARIAFVDLNFSWPPNGGADTDLYHVVLGLQHAGHTVQLFALHELNSTDRGLIDTARLPFKATVLELPRKELAPQRVAAAFRDAVDAWTPDLVFVMHGYALKTYVLQALAHHRTITRYYAHELACLRDPLRFKDGAPCPKDYLRTPKDCRRCALKHQGPAIKSGKLTTWNVDYLAAEAYGPAYHRDVLAALRTAKAVVVSNSQMRAHAADFHDRVFILPGGVHSKVISPKALVEKRPNQKKVILMTGRADDPLKGLHVLLEAGELLSHRRQDFEIWATHFDLSSSQGWYKALGWMEHAQVMQLYAKADVCVAPSIWDEPFGLVAIEAMAAARPVVAARVGGLQDIVHHGVTGFLFTRGDSQELAQALNLLLDRPEMRARMGAHGRALVERDYDWDVIIRGRYLPLIEELLP
jgi:glycosyltransferase involved in cell wall biosynthesis